MVNRKHIIYFLFLFAVLQISGFCLGADLTVKAYLDDTVFGLNQQFTLNIELSGKDAGKVSDPELPDMDTFAAFLGSGSSQNIQFINGKMSASKVISYHYQAVAVGKFQIDPIVVRSGKNEYKTEPITIEIQQTSSSSGQSRSRENIEQESEGVPEGDLFIRALRSKKEVYQSEPVIVTYKIYTRVNVSSFGFVELPGTAGFWAEEIPMSRQPVTTQEVIDGKQYTVATIKKMTLFPMSPGEKIIDPLSVECEVKVRRSRRSRDIFDDFFNDPFGSTVRQIVKSKPIKINVMPLPDQGKPKNFSGVVGNYSISATVDKQNAETNEALAYKLIVSGKGNISALPEIKPVFSSDFEVYPPKVNEQIDRTNGIISGSKTYEYVLVPRVAGHHKINSVQLVTFNPSAGTYQTLTTNEIGIGVTKGKEMAATLHSGLSKEEVRLIGQDIRFIKTSVDKFRKVHSGLFSWPLFWIVLVVPLCSLGCALLYRSHSDRLQVDIAYARERKAGHLARKRLSSAKSCLNPHKQKEFYAEIGKALMGFVCNKLNISEAGMISGEVLTLLKNKGVSQKTCDGFSECLATCDMKRFAPSDATEEEMRSFYKKAESLIVRLNKEIK